MSLPDRKTRIDRGELKSLHTQAMIRKFTHIAPLNGLADNLDAATTNLMGRQVVYSDKVKTMVMLRVEVKYTDLIADQAVRMGLRAAELADGKPGGRIAKTLFPDGTTPIIKPVGGTQVKEMRALEGRYKEVEAIFPAAVDERHKVNVLRTRYESALQGRLTGLEESAQARAARNLAKEEFLDVYSEVANRIRAAFPRDKKTQALFFLRDRTAASVEEGDDDDDDIDDGEDGASSEE
ncbi:hypothetical protein [Chondromyces crocatus]|uniref:Uncharacterized protein n=1 Tax=Chondromyces crocatus TaxID=52 RepID=A0A0K1EQ37_CHOCO|nr:hypothetical protein [Chondromyces crocatus]AKT42728.1 uncharacterized protein CMC5_069550 [Chondromyces crocatus]